MKREYPKVEVGQFWKDRDPRMSRTVQVLRIESERDEGFVYYYDGRNYRSRYYRFQRAFELCPR